MSTFRIIVTAWKADWEVSGYFSPFEKGMSDRYQQIEPDQAAYVETDSIRLVGDTGARDMRDYLLDSLVTEIERQCVIALEARDRE